MPAKPEQVLVRVVNPETGASYAALSGATATRTAGADADHAAFALDAEQVGKFLRRVSGGKVLEITDKDRVKWHCESPEVQGESVVAACVRVGGGS